MALDPGLAAIGGTLAGGLATFAVASADRRFRRQETRDAADREDHLRAIDERRKLYCEFLAAWSACESATSAAMMMFHCSRPPEPQQVSESMKEEVAYELRQAEIRLTGAESQLEIVAPAPVRDPLWALTDHTWRRASLARRRLHWPSFPGEPLPTEPADSGLDRLALMDALTAAMRADLKLNEPVTPSPAARGWWRLPR